MCACLGEGGGEEVGGLMKDSFAQSAVSVSLAGAIDIWAKDEGDSVHICRFDWFDFVWVRCERRSKVRFQVGRIADEMQRNKGRLMVFDDEQRLAEERDMEGV